MERKNAKEDRVLDRVRDDARFIAFDNVPFLFRISKRRGYTSLDISAPSSRGSVKDGRGKPSNDLTVRPNSKSDLGGALSMSPALGPITFVGCVPSLTFLLLSRLTIPTVLLVEMEM